MAVAKYLAPQMSILQVQIVTSSGVQSSRRLQLIYRLRFSVQHIVCSSSLQAVSLLLRIPCSMVQPRDSLWCLLAGRIKLCLIFVPILRFSQAANTLVIFRTPCLSDAIRDCAYSRMFNLFYVFFFYVFLLTIMLCSVYSLPTGILRLL